MLSSLHVLIHLFLLTTFWDHCSSSSFYNWGDRGAEMLINSWIWTPWPTSTQPLLLRPLPCISLVLSWSSHMQERKCMGCRKWVLFKVRVRSHVQKDQAVFQSEPSLFHGHAGGWSWSQNSSSTIWLIIRACPGYSPLYLTSLLHRLEEKIPTWYSF